MSLRDRLIGKRDSGQVVIPPADSRPALKPLLDRLHAWQK